MTLLCIIVLVYPVSLGCGEKAWLSSLFRWTHQCAETMGDCFKLPNPLWPWVIQMICTHLQETTGPSWDQEPVASSKEDPFSSGLYKSSSPEWHLSLGLLRKRTKTLKDTNVLDLKAGRCAQFWLQARLAPGSIMFCLCHELPSEG